jgi:hypothetical protein
MDGSTIISLIALLVSLFALGWQLSRSRWERPVLVVVGTIASRSRSADAGAAVTMEYRITVTNVGERAVTVLSAGWVIERMANGSGSMHITGKDREQPGPRSNPVDEPYVVVVQRPTWREKRSDVGPTRTVYGKVGSLPIELI